MTRKGKSILIVLVAALILIALRFHYDSSQEQAASNQTEAIAEINAVPPSSPLALITEPDDGISQVKEAIDDAKNSIDLVIYELEDPQIEQALVDAQYRGVSVRVIIQNLNNYGQHPNQPAYDFLSNHRVPVIWASNNFALTHQKTIVTDDAQALIMTFNLAPQYYASSRDFGLVDHDPVDVAAIESAFNADWHDKQMPASQGTDLVWSPGSADTLLALINNASKSLDIYNEEMADSRITNALEQAAARGVAVRVIMTYATNWKEALSELVASDVGVHTYASSAKFYIHAKAIIADNVKAFVGSENFSDQSLNRNRELGILISRPDILSELETTFEHDWVGARIFNPDGTSSRAGSSTTPAGANAPAGVVKLSTSKICHPPGDSSYNQTKTFTPYATLADCLAAGGRLPANYKP